MTLGAVIPARARSHLEPVGVMYRMGAEALYWLGLDLVRRRFQYREFVDRAWFLMNATMLPIVLISAPLGMSIVLQVGGLATQLGAGSYVGAADAIAIMREASPIVTALLLATIGGSAVCAELGARTIRDEIDALEVMGINPIQRLVAPLLLAAMVASLFLNLLVMFVGVLAGFTFDLAILHGTKGSFLGSFSLFASVSDLLTSEIKAAVFGVSAGVIAAYRGLSASRGPTGVGEAVNRTVVVAGIVLFAENIVITEIFFALVPQRTF